MSWIPSVQFCLVLNTKKYFNFELSGNKYFSNWHLIGLKAHYKLRYDRNCFGLKLLWCFLMTKDEHFGSHYNWWWQMGSAQMTMVERWRYTEIDIKRWLLLMEGSSVYLVGYVLYCLLWTKSDYYRYHLTKLNEATLATLMGAYITSLCVLVTSGKSFSLTKTLQNCLNSKNKKVFWGGTRKTTKSLGRNYI